MKTVEFYYDFASPTAFIGYHRLIKLAKKYPVNIVYKPILLGALHKATGNTPPGTVPAKGAYLLLVDLPRFTKQHNIELEFNPHFPVNCIKALRGALFMEGKDQEDKYRETIYNAIWQNKENIADETVFKNILSAVDIDPAPILAGIEDEAIKQKLKDNTAEAVDRGAFGAPTFYVGEEMFFGQDRLDFVESILAED